MLGKFAFLIVGFLVLVQYSSADSGEIKDDTTDAPLGGSNAPGDPIDDSNTTDATPVDPNAPRIIGGAPCYGSSGMGLWCKKFPWQPKCKCFWQYCKHCFPYFKNPLCSCLKECTGY